MNGLEALEKICNRFPLNSTSSLITPIEKELKEHEQYKEFVQDICNYLGLDDLFPYTDLNEIGKQIKSMSDNSHWFVAKQNEKKLKALEIINEKDVHIKYFKDSNSLDEYNEYRIYFGNLTKDEYDLLKEILK